MKVYIFLNNKYTEYKQRWAKGIGDLIKTQRDILTGVIEPT